jgi:RNA polymerase sigma-70 factor (sigma-E family)
MRPGGARPDAPPTSDAEGSFTAFAAACYPRMVRLGCLLLAGDPEGEDLVQIALVRLAAHWHRIDEPEAYVRQVLVNLAADHGRHRRRRPWLLMPPEDLPDSRNWDSGAGSVDEMSSFTALLRRLPTRQRQVLVLRYWHDLSEAEIARLLGCSVGAVKSHAHRALHRLRDEAGLLPLTSTAVV